MDEVIHSPEELDTIREKIRGIRLRHVHYDNKTIDNVTTTFGKLFDYYVEILGYRKKFWGE